MPDPVSGTGQARSVIQFEFLVHDRAFWVDVAENRLYRFHREPAYIANYVRIVVKERRAQKDETMNWRLH